MFNYSKPIETFDIDESRANLDETEICVQARYNPYGHSRY